MKGSRMRCRSAGPHDIRGATIVEYTLAVALVILVLLWVNDLLVGSAHTRARFSAGVVEDMAPCGNNFRGEQCH